LASKESAVQAILDEIERVMALRLSDSASGGLNSYTRGKLVNELAEAAAWISNPNQDHGISSK
jgi:hypothetical protein